MGVGVGVAALWVGVGAPLCDLPPLPEGVAMHEYGPGAPELSYCTRTPLQAIDSRSQEGR